MIGGLAIGGIQLKIVQDHKQTLWETENLGQAHLGVFGFLLGHFWNARHRNARSEEQGCHRGETTCALESGTSGGKRMRATQRRIWGFRNIEGP